MSYNLEGAEGVRKPLKNLLPVSKVTVIGNSLIDSSEGSDTSLKITNISQRVFNIL
jgi:hypothetical protein